MTTKKNLLFISPDALPSGISRAYWLANGLSRFFNVYYVQWEDSRKYRWLSASSEKPISNSKICVSAYSFFKSCFTKTRFVKQTVFGAKNLFYTYIPIMQKSALSHFVGEVKARQLARKFNELSLRKLLKKVEFSYIFHGENLMLAPHLSDSIPSFYDVQDDFDETADSIELLSYEKEYQKKNAAKCKKRFAINDSTADHLASFTGCSFEVLPNGADFSVFNHDNHLLAQKMKLELGLAAKKVVVFIGSASHFDQEFTTKLANLAIEKNPDVHFLLIGNLPRVEKQNVTNLGLVSPTEIHLYYMLADIGFMPQAIDDPYVKNCHPLKVVQFSAAQKPMITPLLSSYQSGDFANVFPTDYEPEYWSKRIEDLADFEWNESLTDKWSEFSWAKIVARLAAKISVY